MVILPNNKKIKKIKGQRLNFNKNKSDVENKIVIDAETAELEFERFCEEWEIDNDLSDLSEEDEKGFLKHKKVFLNAVIKGRLKFNENDKLEYTVSHHSEFRDGDQLIIKMPGGRDYKVFDKYKSKETMAQEQALYASLIGKTAGYIDSLVDIDMRVIKAVVILFLAA